MRIIAFDQSIAKTGYCVMTENRDLVDYGLIKTSQNKENHERLLQIYDKATRLIKQHLPTHIIIEDTYLVSTSKNKHFSGNGNIMTLKVLNQVRGVIMLACAELNVRPVVLTTVEARKLITGSGKTTKEDIRKIILEQYRLEDANDDITDAIALALAFLEKCSGGDVLC